jgi:formylglycine-generating enzyme required for sulfatase activity
MESLATLVLAGCAGYLLAACGGDGRRVRPDESGVATDGVVEDDATVETLPDDVVAADAAEAGPGDGAVEAPCVPSCAGKTCGDDGCGGDCGRCPIVPGWDVACSVPAHVCEYTGGPGSPTVPVPAATFMMGCNLAVDPDPTCNGSEKPCHEVAPAAFEVDQTEVTVAAYRACVDAGACSEVSTISVLCNWDAPASEALPVNCITWPQAVAYCEWVGKRLCTEAEWELAARGTDGRRYPWGNGDPTCELAVFKDGEHAGCGTDSTWAVGSLPDGASPFGAFDMAGNLSEWVRDCWHDSYLGADRPDDGTAWETSCSGADRVLRGGCYSNWPGALRTSARGHGPPTHVADTIGARCCKSP